MYIAISVVCLQHTHITLINKQIMFANQEFFIKLATLHVNNLYSHAQELFYKLFSKITNKLKLVK